MAGRLLERVQFGTQTVPGSVPTCPPPTHTTTISRQQLGLTQVKPLLQRWPFRLHLPLVPASEICSSPLLPLENSRSTCLRWNFDLDKAPGQVGTEHRHLDLSEEMENREVVEAFGGSQRNKLWLSTVLNPVLFSTSPFGFHFPLAIFLVNQ